MSRPDAQVDRLRIFISYSRSDGPVADALVESLIARGFDVKIDRRDLEFGEKWQTELAEFITSSDTVIWLVSPRSVTSQSVNWELDEVVRRNKRLVPVMVVNLDFSKLPRQLGEIHILPAEGEFDFGRDFDALVRVLETDRAWLKESSRLQDRAYEWIADGRKSARLLWGSALTAGERWKEFRPAKAPAPSKEVLDLLLASRQAATRRQRAWAIGSLAVAIVAVGLAGTALWQWLSADQQRTIAAQRAAILSVDVADSLADRGQNDAAVLTLLDAARNFSDGTAPDTLLISLDRVLRRSLQETNFYFSPKSKSFFTRGRLFVFDSATRSLFAVTADGRSRTAVRYPYEPLAAELHAGGKQLIIVRTDYRVDKLDIESGALVELGSLIGEDTTTPNEPKLKTLPDGQPRLSLNADGIVIALFETAGLGAPLSFTVIDTERRSKISSKLEGVQDLRYISTEGGIRTFAAADKKWMYQPDADFTRLIRRPELDATWNPLLLCRELRGGSTPLVANQRMAAIEWTDWQGDQCLTASGNSALFYNFISGSSGGSHHYTFIDDKQDWNIVESLLGDIGTKFQSSLWDGGHLGNIDLSPDASRIALSYNREVFALNKAKKFVARINLSVPPSIVRFASNDTLVLVQDTPTYHKITFQALDEAPVTNGSTTSEARRKTGALNKGTCAGYLPIFSNDAILPDGEKIVFDFGSPATVDRKPVLQFGTSEAHKIDINESNLGCVQFNERFTRMLIVHRGRVDVYDVDSVRRGGGLAKALIGTIKDTSLTGSAFFIGKSDQVLTPHNTNRILRWSLGPNGYTSEQVYLGDYPIIYAEPDADGKRILVGEYFGFGAVGVHLFSLEARRKWLDLINAYKRFAVAFAATGDIYYGDDELRDGAVFHFQRLGDLSSVAWIALASDCRVPEGTGIGASVCWPVELDSRSRAPATSARDPKRAAGVALLLADLGRAQASSKRTAKARALFDEAEQWAKTANDPAVLASVIDARSRQPTKP